MTPKRILGTLFSLVFTAFLLAGLLVIVNLSQKSQDVKRSKAAGENVTLSLSGSTTGPININDTFTVTVSGGSVANVKITAIETVLNYSRNLSVVSIVPTTGAGTFFSYTPTTTEALSLGTTCATETKNTDCRTAAAITCKNNICTSGSGYPTATAGKIRFALGAACSIAEPWVCYPTTSGGGTLAIVTFKATAAGAASVSFDQTANTGTLAAGIDNSGTALTTTVGTFSITNSQVGLTVNGADGALADITFKVIFDWIKKDTATTTHNPRIVKVVLKQSRSIVKTFDSVTLTPDNTVAVGSYIPYTGTVTGITTGTYDILVKGWGHLQRRVTPTLDTLVAGVNNRNWAISGLILKAGDMAGNTPTDSPNNVVEVTDLQALLNKFNASVQAPVGTKEDLNDDGLVETTDLQMLLNNFDASVTGDQ